MTDHLGRNEDRNITGTFTPGELAIICEREPEVGIAWMACVHEFGRCALGKTPGEATRSLIQMLARDNIAGVGQVFERNCESLEKTGSVRRPI
jgi:hypothetical protein